MFFWELKRQKNKALLYGLFYSAVLLGTALFVMLLDESGYLSHKIVEGLRRFPEMVADVFLFLKSREMTAAMKGNLLMLLFLFLPVLYYAMLLPVNAFEKEEQMHTIAYTLNGATTRKQLFICKSTVSVLYWFFSVLVWFLISLVLLLSAGDRGGRLQMLRQLILIWGSLFITGLFMMSLSLFYVSVKRQTAAAGDFCFYVLFWLTLVRLLPFLLSFISSVLFQFGYGVQTITAVIGRLNAVLEWIPIFWGNPVHTYVHFMDWQQIVLSMAGAAALSAAAFLNFMRRDFGECS